MKIFNLAEELEKERKKNKELEKEINRLTAESTHYESKYYNEAKKVDKAIQLLEDADYWDDIGNELLPLLKGEENE